MNETGNCPTVLTAPAFLFVQFKSNVLNPMACRAQQREVMNGRETDTFGQRIFMVNIQTRTVSIFRNSTDVPRIEAALVTVHAVRLPTIEKEPVCQPCSAFASARPGFFRLAFQRASHVIVDHRLK
jgi:hypothetical protein